MKKVFLTLILSLVVAILFAQKDTVRLREISGNQNAIVTDRAPQAIYFLVLGSGPFLSINYDRRFQKRVNGAGFSAGLGFWGESDITLFSIPVSINYLLGRTTHFVEIAGGATFITGSIDLFGKSSGSGIFYHINAGYRYQPTRGGFFFRGGISPLFFPEAYIKSYYLGFDTIFKCNS